MKYLHKQNNFALQGNQSAIKIDKGWQTQLITGTELNPSVRTTTCSFLIMGDNVFVNSKNVGTNRTETIM